MKAHNPKFWDNLGVWTKRDGGCFHERKESYGGYLYDSTFSLSVNIYGCPRFDLKKEHFNLTCKTSRKSHFINQSKIELWNSIKNFLELNNLKFLETFKTTASAYFLPKTPLEFVKNYKKFDTEYEQTTKASTFKIKDPWGSIVALYQINVEQEEHGELLRRTYKITDYNTSKYCIYENNILETGCEEYKIAQKTKLNDVIASIPVITSINYKVAKFEL